MPENCPIGVTPYAETTLVKNPPIINLNYTNQDFWSLKSRLVDFIRERFGEEGTELPNTFNDFVEGSIAIMLIENWAFIADTLSFKMDQIVNELFIDTVTEIENAFRQSKLVGFEPQPPIAARAMFSATIANIQDTDISIPTPIIIDIVSEDQPTRYELFAADSNNQPIFDSDIIIPAGSTSNDSVVGLEGRTTTDTFNGTGEVNQTIQAVGFPVIFDSIRVNVDGVEWSRVPFFTDGERRREYRVEFNSSYQAFIIFGNNRAGLLPSPGSRIRLTYRIGGGQVGNIVTGFIETQRVIAVPGKKFSIPIFYRNYTRGEFGYDGDTISDIRRKLPEYLRTQNRAVSGSDYKILADQFATPYSGQIGKSNPILRNHGCSGNIIDLYILARDGNNDLAEATNELKVLLNEELNQKKMLTDFICIKDGVVIRVEILVEIVMDRFYRKFEPEFRDRIYRRIADFFNINNWDFNKDLRDIDLIKETSDIKEIQSIDITFITDDENNSGNMVNTRYFEIIRPDDITISFVFV